jgi:hypothetical protein
VVEWVSAADKSVPDSKVGKSVGLISLCNHRKGDMCHVLSGIPEKATCICSYFKTTNKDAIKKFNDLCAEYKCKGKIKIRNRITYFDMLKLDEFRGGGY